MGGSTSRIGDIPIRHPQSCWVTAGGEAVLGWHRHGYGGDLEAASQGELAQDVAHVVLGSFGGDEQLLADLDVSQPLADEIDYLPLAPAEGRQRVRRGAGTVGHLGTEPSQEGPPDLAPRPPPPFHTPQLRPTFA